MRDRNAIDLNGLILKISRPINRRYQLWLVVNVNISVLDPDAITRKAHNAKDEGLTFSIRVAVAGEYVFVWSTNQKTTRSPREGGESRYARLSTRIRSPRTR